jgi:8-oxo-dGTP pyrophosphatase MutT (NUDIX family)
VSKTEIVLAVVCCDGLICLARRSQRVATARGMWSVVTGYVEPDTDPLRQVWTELEEELGLSAPAVHLVRRMDAVPLTSPGSGKQFLVYPFLFECPHGPTLVLNWENDEAQWAEPARLDAPDGVRWQLPLVRALLAADGS